jgi:hypothetical protein
VRKYRLDPRRVAIGGFSMGGFGALVWIDVGTEDPFRSADNELAGLLPQARFQLWRGGHEISWFDDHATEILRFYANALRDC